MSRIDQFTPSAAVAASNKPQTIDKAAAVAKYGELCALRDNIERDVAPLRKKVSVAADAAEAARVASNDVAAELYTARGGSKWFQLKKEIGILAAVTTGAVPPTSSQLELAAAILGGK